MYSLMWFECLTPSLDSRPRLNMCLNYVLLTQEHFSSTKFSKFTLASIRLCHSYYPGLNVLLVNV